MSPNRTHLLITLANRDDLELFTTQRIEDVRKVLREMSTDQGVLFIDNTMINMRHVVSIELEQLEED